MDIKDFNFEKKQAERLFPHVEEATEFLVFCRKSDYCASQICRAVEDCDAHVLNLNVTADTAPGDEAVVHLRVNVRTPDAVVRSVERFGYTAVALNADDDSEEYLRARDNANELIRYLEL